MRNVAGFLLVGTALIASAGCKKNKGDKTTPENVRTTEQYSYI
jgi:hypothetical protein